MMHYGWLAANVTAPATLRPVEQLMKSMHSLQ